MAPSRKSKKAVSVTYIPDRSKAVDMGKRITLKKRRTTIRPITFDITVDESDSPTPVNSVPDSQPEFTMDDKSQPPVTNVRMALRKAEADSPLVSSKDQAEGKEHKNQTQATAGHQSSMVNVGHQSSMVNVGHQPVATSLVKAGNQSFTGVSTRHQSRTAKAGHKSATSQAEHKSLPVEAGSQSLGNQLSVHQTAEVRSSAIEAVNQPQTSSTGHQSRSVETVNQSVRHKTMEPDSAPGNREGDQTPSGSNSMSKTSRNVLTRAQQQHTSGNNTAQTIQTGLQPPAGKENDADRGTADNAKLSGLRSHHLRSYRPQGETKLLSTIKSALKKAKTGNGCNVPVDHAKSSALQVIQPPADKSELVSKVAATHAQQNSPLKKDKTTATSRIPSDDSNLNDIFRVPLPVNGSVYSLPMSASQTPCDTPMRPPNVSSSQPAASSSTSPNFDMVPVNGRPSSGGNVGRDGNNVTRGTRAKRRQLLTPATSDDQPLQDIVITVKRSSSSSSSDEDHSTRDRPTVSNLTELTVIMSAMEDTVQRFLSETQASARIKRFLRDVADDTFAKLRRTSQASHSISKLNKQLNASHGELRKKRKELLQLQQEHVRLEVEVAASKKAISSGTAVDRSDVNKINDYLLKLSQLTPGI